MQTFKKHERLSGQKIIDTLFSEGKIFVVSPFRVVWLEYELAGQSPAQVLISVSKKRIKNAVDRNLVKRRIREAYRKNKDEFYEFLNRNQVKCAFALLYNSDLIADYKEIEEKINLLLQRFQSEYEKSNR
jgi:ribonuclease P protein component